MSKVAEFLNKVAADEAARAEFDAVFGVRKERELNDGDFQKIVELSEKLGAAVTPDEVKDFFSGNGRELSEEELAGVAGGRSSTEYWSFDCPLCGEKISENLPVIFRDGALEFDIVKRHAQEYFKFHLIMDHRDLFGCTSPLGVDENIAEQKAEELMKPEWEKFVKRGEWWSS